MKEGETLIIDLTGQSFGMLTVVEPSGRSKNGEVMWLCRCECGNYKTVRSSILRGGRIKSCGCRPNTSHGLSNTRIYQIWIGMKRRCYDSNSEKYKLYGGRSIKVCDEWRNDPGAFFSWALENGYEDTLTIDRIDVKGNYEPSNCRWATAIMQANNSSSNHRITYRDVTLSLADWCRILDLPYGTIQSRIRSRWSIEEAFETPIGHARKQKGGSHEQIDDRAKGNC